jgi:hypothetical protein
MGADAQNQPMYRVYAVPSGNPNSHGRLVHAGHDAINRTDSIKVSVTGAALQSYFNLTHRTSSRSEDLASAAEVLRSSAVAATRVAQGLTQMARSATDQKSENVRFSERSGMSDISEGLRQFAASLQSGRLGESFLGSQAQPLTEALRAPLNESLADARRGLTVFEIARSGAAAGRRQLAENVVIAKRALRALEVVVNVRLAILREVDPGRGVNANPIALLTQHDAAAVQAAQEAARAFLQQLQEAMTQVGEAGATFQTMLADADTILIAQIPRLTDPKLGAFKQTVDDLNTLVKRLKQDYSDLGPDLARHFLDNGLQDLSDLHSSWVKVLAARDAVQEADLHAIAADVVLKVSTAIAQQEPLLRDLQALKEFLNALKPVYQQIDEVSQTVTGDLNKSIDVFFPNIDGTLNKAKLASEDQIKVFVRAKPVEPALGATAADPVVDSEGFTEIPPVTVLYAFAPRAYWTSATAAIGARYRGSSTFKPGAMQFASLHFSTNSAAFNMNFGLTIGVGTATSFTSNSVGTAVGLGLSLVKDKIFGGYGRNLASNENFWFVGLRVLPFGQ